MEDYPEELTQRIVRVLGGSSSVYPAPEWDALPEINLQIISVLEGLAEAYPAGLAYIPSAFVPLIECANLNILWRISDGLADFHKNWQADFAMDGLLEFVAACWIDAVHSRLAKTESRDLTAQLTHDPAGYWVFEAEPPGVDLILDSIITRNLWDFENKPLIERIVGSIRTGDWDAANAAGVLSLATRVRHSRRGENLYRDARLRSLAFDAPLLSSISELHEKQLKDWLGKYYEVVVCI